MPGADPTFVEGIKLRVGRVASLDGLAAIEQCAALLASPDLDSSLRLPRSMFDRDPELALLRAQPRWEAAMRRAFADAPARDDEGGRGR